MRISLILFGLCTLLLVSATTAEEQSISIWDMIPGIAQGKSLVQLIFGDKEGAVKTQEHFLNDGLGSSQLRSGYFLVTGEPKKALEIQKKFVTNLEGVLDGLPVVGHVKGGIHLLTGEHDHGWQAIKAATSTSGAIAGAMLAGPAGAVGGHLLTDALITVTDVALNGNQSQPHGMISYVVNIDKLKPGEHFDVLASLVFDARAGKGIAKRDKFYNGGFSHEKLADSYELQPLLEEKGIDNQRTVGMPKELKTLTEDTEPKSNEPGPLKSNEPGPSKSNEPGSLKSNEPGPSKSNEPGPSKSNEPGPSKSYEPGPSKRNEPGPSKSYEPGPSETNEPSPSKITKYTSNPKELFNINFWRFKKFLNFLQQNPTYKEFNLHNLRSDNIINMNFDKLDDFQYNQHLEDLDINSLKNKLSYLNDDQKSLINEYDFRTINTEASNKNCIGCSIAGILKMNLKTVQKYIYENLDFSDPLNRYQPEFCLDSLEKRKLITYTMSQKLNSLEELDMHLKLNALKLENKPLLLEQGSKFYQNDAPFSNPGHILVLKYKIVKDNPEPVKLLVDYQYQGFLKSDIPNPFRFQTFINNSKFDHFYVYDIDLLKQ